VREWMLMDRVMGINLDFAQYRVSFIEDQGNRSVVLDDVSPKREKCF
jgi:hypothetical protein